MTSFQKLQISRCNSSAVFITLSLKRYSERGLVKGFGFFLLFFYVNNKFHLGNLTTLGRAAGCRKFYQLQTISALGFSTGTAQSVQPPALLGRYQATKMQCMQQWLGWHLHSSTINRVKN